jgi:hypothetical protein
MMQHMCCAHNVLHTASVHHTAHLAPCRPAGADVHRCAPPRGEGVQLSPVLVEGCTGHRRQPRCVTTARSTCTVWKHTPGAHSKGVQLGGHHVAWPTLAQVCR